MTIKIYKDNTANAIFIEDSNGVQFLNSLQATSNGDGVSIKDLARSIDIVTDEDFPNFVNENDDSYGNNSTDVTNSLNAIFASSGASGTELPQITSNLSINLVEGETLNYELTANFGVGYEWDLSSVPSVTTVDGNIRKLVGGSSLPAGTYNIPVTAINYNGNTDDKTQTPPVPKSITLTVSNPPFANTKSVNFNNNDYLGANAAQVESTLGRSSNGSGASDAWSIAFWFKPGTATNASQTAFYFGSQDVANQGNIQIKYNGSLKRFDFKYGTNNNRLNFSTPSNSLTVGQWHHFVMTYDGGTTGSSSSSLNDYYGRFKFFLDGVEVTTSMIKSHNNYGYTGSVIGQNLRVGRYNNGQNLRNNCRVDELAIYSEDVSSFVSSIYNNGSATDLMNLIPIPEHWWRMGDGDSFPFLLDYGFQANCIFQMYNMTAADIVSDVP